MSRITSISRFGIAVALEVRLLVKSPLDGGLAKFDTTGHRDPGQPFAADDVSVNSELQACGFYRYDPTQTLF